jgi:hypothetical protein
MKYMSFLTENLTFFFDGTILHLPLYIFKALIAVPLALLHKDITVSMNLHIPYAMCNRKPKETEFL